MHEWLIFMRKRSPISMVNIHFPLLPELSRLISSWKTEKLSIFWFAHITLKNLCNCLHLLLSLTFIYMKNNEWWVWLLFSWLFCLKSISSFSNFTGSPRPQNWSNVGQLWCYCTCRADLCVFPFPSHLIAVTVDVSGVFFLFQGEARRLFNHEKTLEKFWDF